MEASEKNVAVGHMSADVIAAIHKRDRDEARILDSWTPGSGAPNKSGPDQKQERLLKTSLLFLQLEVFIIDFSQLFQMYGILPVHTVSTFACQT
jgi:hypothetical protein